MEIKIKKQQENKETKKSDLIDPVKTGEVTLFQTI